MIFHFPSTTINLLPVEVKEYIETDFDETAGCTGYDKDVNYLMVPMEDSNKIKVKIPGIGSNDRIYVQANQ